MPFITALFDLLKGVALPAVILIIALRYQTDIRSLFPRLRKASLTGLELDPAEQQQKTAVVEVSDPASVEPKDIPGVSRTPAMEAIERSLHSNILDVSEDEHVNLIIALLAEARLFAVLELIYRLIFGSQIQGLRLLNQVPKASIKEAKEFYDTAQERWPALSDYGFDRWVGFLKNYNLVQQNDDLISISEMGREFLIYLTHKRLSENKPL